MNAVKTFRPINVIALTATLLALLALALLPASRAFAAGAPLAGGLSLSPAKDAQTVATGQTAYHTYELQNQSPAPIKVSLAAKNSAGWPVSLSASLVEIPANGAIKFVAKIQVPATATAESTTVITAQVANGDAGSTAYWMVQPGPALSNPTPVPSNATN